MRFRSAAAKPCGSGVGLAGMWYRFGKSGTLRIEAQAELARDGRFVVYCSAADYGQGITTVMSQLAADALGVSREQVEVVNGDSRVLTAASRSASRATYFVGGAVTAAARRSGGRCWAWRPRCSTGRLWHLRYDRTA